MTATAIAPRGGRKEWLIPASLILMGLVPSIAGTARLAELAGNSQLTTANARFFDQPIPVVLHILSVVPYAMVGAFQFAPGFRRRNRPWHKAAGRIIGMFGLMAAISGLWMTFTYPWPYGDGVGVYVERIVFGVAMLVSMILGLDAVRRRDFKAHGRWMIRAYAIGMGAGTQVLTHLPWFILSDAKPGEGPRTVMMGSAWLINWLFAEWIIRRGERRRAGTFPSMDQPASARSASVGSTFAARMAGTAQPIAPVSASTTTTPT